MEIITHNTDGTSVASAMPAAEEAAHIAANFRPPLPLKQQAQAALEKTSVTVERIVEASVLNPTVCKMTNQDVIDFMTYRKKLRDIITGFDAASTALPPAPGTVGGIPFPAGT